MGGGGSHFQEYDIIVAFKFDSFLQDIFTRPGNSLPLQLLSYCIVLFPSIDVISAYPLRNHVIVNNVYILIMGQDTSREPKHRFDWLLRIFLRFINALLPILAAFGVANLIYVLKFAGLVSFMCFVFPVFLQLRSIDVCERRFSPLHMSLSDSKLQEKPDSIEDKDIDEKDDLEISPFIEKKDLLLATNEVDKVSTDLYMTPYSNSLLSHPTFVWVVAGSGMALLLLAFLSLFLHPRKLTCDMQ